MTQKMMPPRKPVRRFTGLVGLPPDDPVSTPAQNPALKGAVISEDELRAQLGVEERSTKRKLPESYRSLLNLEPDDIISFFDKQVGANTEFDEIDFIVPPSMLEHRIKRLQKIMACSKQIIEGLSVRVMKIRRGKDNVLDQPTREKFKREENARIARCNAKLFLYRAALRSDKSYHEKIWRWVTKPIYFRDVIDDQMFFEEVIGTRYIEGKAVLTRGVHTHNLTELVDFLKRGYFDLQGYQTLLKLDEAALEELGETETERMETWKNFAKWENAVIRAAVLYGIISPRRDLAELLGLGSILDEDDNPIEADRIEDALAIKTKGACYGGRIKGEYRFRDGKFIRRALTSFDKPFKEASRDEGGQYRDTGFGSLRDLSDDTESYDAR